MRRRLTKRRRDIWSQCALFTRGQSTCRVDSHRIPGIWIGETNPIHSAGLRALASSDFRSSRAKRRCNSAPRSGPGRYRLTRGPWINKSSSPAEVTGTSAVGASAEVDEHVSEAAPCSLHSLAVAAGARGFDSRTPDGRRSRPTGAPSPGARARGVSAGLESQKMRTSKNQGLKQAPCCLLTGLRRSSSCGGVRVRLYLFENISVSAAHAGARWTTKDSSRNQRPPCCLSTASVACR